MGRNETLPRRPYEGKGKMQRRRQFQISDGSVDIVRIYKAAGMRKTPNRVTRRRIAHVFTGVTRAGAASRRPYGRNSTPAEEVNTAISDLRLEKRQRQMQIPYSELRARDDGGSPAATLLGNRP